MVGMQSRSGGWGAFDVDNEALWLYKLPICDFGKVTDEPSADVTAHALEALGREEGYDAEQAAGWTGCSPSRSTTAPGSAAGASTTSTAPAPPSGARGLRRLRRPSAIRRAIAGSTRSSSRTAASARTSRSYGDPPARPRRGDAFADGMGPARLRLGRARRGLSARRAAEYLLSVQRPDGDWDEQHYTGTGFPLDFMIRYHLYRLTFPAPRPRAPERKAHWMKFPLRSTVQIGKYVASQQRKGERYPLVLMLEPTLACNIACIGCGKIREYESNKARLSVEECIDAGAQCPAPVVSICGGEPLVYKGIEDVVAGMLELGKNIDLCTNALKLEQFLDVFKPTHD
jgi:hypothetical protein